MGNVFSSIQFCEVENLTFELDESQDGTQHLVIRDGYTRVTFSGEDAAYRILAQISHLINTTEVTA